MYGFLQFLALCVALTTAGALLYAIWVVALRPHLPWEKDALILAEWMNDVFGARAAEEAFERAAFEATPRERRKWRRVGLYLIGRR